MAESYKGTKKSSVVIVGAGFAGFNAARELSRLAGKISEITVINSTDYFLYLPLMPQVTGMSGNPLRVLTDWALNGITSPESTSLTVIGSESIPLDINEPPA